MASSSDNQADRKASAASADDDAVFNITPYGRQRRPGHGRSTLRWILHFVGFPFFYVYNQLRDRRRSKAQRWADDAGRHGVEPAPRAADTVPGTK